MKFLAFSAAILIASAAVADPAYYRVTGVASDDTLNVRADPSSDSADIGDLPPDTTGIEVLGTDPTGLWGRIIWQEAMGWISMRFLEADAVQTIPGTELPVGLQCGGTEPFWTMKLSATGAVYSDLEGAALTLGMNSAQVAQGYRAFPVALGHSGQGAGTLSVVSPNMCSDSMSDRDYPYSLTVVLENAGKRSFLAGCCWLPLETGSN